MQFNMGRHRKAIEVWTLRGLGLGMALTAAAVSNRKFFFNFWGDRIEAIACAVVVSLAVYVGWGYWMRMATLSATRKTGYALTTVIGILVIALTLFDLGSSNMIMKNERTRDLEAERQREISAVDSSLVLRSWNHLIASNQEKVQDYQRLNAGLEARGSNVRYHTRYENAIATGERTNARRDQARERLVAGINEKYDRLSRAGFQDTGLGQFVSYAPGFSITVAAILLACIAFCRALDHNMIDLENKAVSKVPDKRPRDVKLIARSIGKTTSSSRMELVRQDTETNDPCPRSEKGAVKWLFAQVISGHYDNSKRGGDFAHAVKRTRTARSRRNWLHRHGVIAAQDWLKQEHRTADDIRRKLSQLGYSVDTVRPGVESQSNGTNGKIVV